MDRKFSLNKIQVPVYNTISWKENASLADVLKHEDGRWTMQKVEPILCMCKGIMCLSGPPISPVTRFNPRL